MGVSIWELQAKGAEATAKSLTKIKQGVIGVATKTAELKKTGGVAAAVGDTKELAAARKLQESLTAELSKRRQVYEQLRQSIALETDVTKWRELRDETSMYRQGISDLEGELKSVQKRLRGIKDDASDAFDSFSNPAMSITQGLRGVGQSVAGQSFEGIGAQVGASANSLAEFVDNAGQMRETLRDVGPMLLDTARGFAPVGKGLQGVLGGLKSGTAGLASTLGTIGVAAVGVTAVLLAVGKAFEMVQSITNAARTSTEQYVEALRTQMALRTEIDELIATGDAEAMQQRLEQEQRRKDELQRLLDETNAQIARVDQRYAELGSSLNIPARTELGESGRTLRESLESIQAEFGTTAASVNELQQSMADAQRAARAREESERKATNLANAEDELTQVRIQARDSTEDFRRSLEEFAENIAYESSQRQRERLRDDSKSSRDHQAEIARITNDGRKQIAGIHRDYWKTLATIAKDEAKEAVKAAARYAKSQIQIELDYNKSYVEAHVRRNKALAKEEKQHARELLRQQEDLHDSLFDAEFENNAVAFIQAKRDADKQRERDEQDRAWAAEDEREAFEEELADLIAQRDERREELRTAYREEQADRAESLRERLADEKSSYLERLAEQRQSNTDSIAEARASYQTQRAELLEQRAWEDQQTAEANRRQLEQMTTSHNDQIAELEDREEGLLHVIQTGGDWQIQEVRYQQLELVSVYRDGARQAVAAAREAIAGIGGSGTRTTTGSGSRTATPRPGRPGVWADSGGIFDKPTFTLLAEKRPEAVIPLKQSGGLANDLIKALGGAMRTPSITFGDIHVGDGVSEAVVRQNFQEMAKVLVKALNDARAGTPYRAY